jgi:hypothetical protein
MLRAVSLLQGLDRGFSMLVAMYLQSLYGAGEFKYTGSIWEMSMKVIRSPHAMPARRIQMRGLQIEQ